MINRFALSFVCIELDRNEIYEVMFVYILLMIEVYKYTHGLYKVSALPVEVEEKTTRGHNYKLKKKRCSTTRRLKFFSMRVVNAWNSLPVGLHVVNAVSVNAFKSRLVLGAHNV